MQGLGLGDLTFPDAKDNYSTFLLLREELELNCTLKFDRNSSP
jgi:hypothetical protein